MSNSNRLPCCEGVLGASPVLHVANETYTKVPPLKKRKITLGAEKLQSLRADSQSSKVTSNTPRSSSLKEDDSRMARIPMVNLTKAVGPCGPLEELAFKDQDLAVHQKSLHELEDAIRSTDDDEKEAYMEAITKYPHLVMRESCPTRFLKVDSSPEQAAQRLVGYWKARKDLFGERAFLPLTQTGDGALCKEDLQILATGYFVMLPKNSKGELVLCLDQSRASGSMDHIKTRVNKMRCAFYLLNVVSVDDAAQSHGLQILRISTYPQLDMTKGSAFANAVSVMPVRFNHLHLCCLPPPGAKRMFEQTLLPVSIQFCEKECARFGAVVRSHLADSEEDMLVRLVVLGMEKNSLPATLGGTWTYDLFPVWQREQMEREKALVEVKAIEQRQQSQAKKRQARGVASANDVAVSSVSIGTSATSRKPAPGNTPDSLSKLIEAADIVRIEERKARKRRLDAMYARKRRQRERKDEENLQMTCLKLSRENMKLEEDNKRLDKLLADARMKILLQKQPDAKPAASVTEPASSENTRSTAPTLPAATADIDTSPALAMLKLQQPASQVTSGMTDAASLLGLLQQQQLVQQHTSGLEQALQMERALSDQLLQIIQATHPPTQAPMPPPEPAPSTTSQLPMQTIKSLLRSVGRPFLSNAVPTPPAPQVPVPDPSVSLSAESLLALLGALGGSPSEQQPLTSPVAMIEPNTEYDPKFLQVLLHGQEPPAQPLLQQTLLQRLSTAAPAGPEQQVDNDQQRLLHALSSASPNILDDLLAKQITGLYDSCIRR